MSAPMVVIRREKSRVSSAHIRRIFLALRVLLDDVFNVRPADVTVVERRRTLSSPREVDLEIEIGNGAVCKDLRRKVADIQSRLMDGGYVPSGARAVIRFPGGELHCCNGFNHSWTWYEDDEA